MRQATTKQSPEEVAGTRLRSQVEGQPCKRGRDLSSGAQRRKGGLGGAPPASVRPGCRNSLGLASDHLRIHFRGRGWAPTSAQQGGAGVLTYPPEPPCPRLPSGNSSAHFPEVLRGPARDRVSHIHQRACRVAEPPSHQPALETGRSRGRDALLPNREPRQAFAHTHT